MRALFGKLKLKICVPLRLYIPNVQVRYGIGERTGHHTGGSQ
jgi:hypothetical protein